MNPEEIIEKKQTSSRGLNMIALILEILVLYPWVMWVSSWSVLQLDGPPLNFIMTVLLAASTQELTRYSLNKNWTLTITRLVIIPAVILLLAFAVFQQRSGSFAVWDVGSWNDAAQSYPAFIATVALGLFTVGRAISLGRNLISYDQLYQRFLVGLTSFSILLVLWGTTAGSSGFQRTLASIGIFVAGFFFFSLSGLIVANLRSGWPTIWAGESTMSFFNRSWLSLYVGVVGLIVGLATLVSLTPSMNLLGAIGRVLMIPLSTIGNLVIWVVVLVIVYPIAFLGSFIVDMVRPFFSDREATEPSLSPPEMDRLQDYVADGELPGFLSELVLVAKWSLVALLLLGIIFFLVRMLARKKERPSDDVEVFHEAIWSWDALKGDLRQLLLATVRFLFRVRSKQVPVAREPVSLGVDELNQSFTIREIYQGVLWEGRYIGVPRHLHETVYEYQARLAEHVPDATNDLQTITDAYVANRYGSVRIEGTRLRALNTCWLSLLTVFRDGPTPIPES